MQFVFFEKGAQSKAPEAEGIFKNFCVKIIRKVTFNSKLQKKLGGGQDVLVAPQIIFFHGSRACEVIELFARYR